jgi:Glycosyltransferase family 87
VVGSGARDVGRLAAVAEVVDTARAAPGRPRSAGGWTTLLPSLVAFALLAGLTAAAIGVGAPNDARWTLLAVIGAMWLAFALAARTVLRMPARQAVPLVIAGGILLQGIGLAAAPRSTDDFYRYAWDGRVQAAGIDPYRYPPNDPALVALRDDWLFPPDCRPSDPACTIINHPQYRTLYPPVAQVWFRAVHAVSPAGSRHKPWQLAAALLAVLTALAIVAVLRRSGRDPRWAVLWAWCPTVAIEAGNAAHVDVLGVLLLVAGLGLVARRRAAVGGGLLGAAVAVKFLPALVFPAVLRRRGLVVLGAAAATFAVSYLPHVLAVGPDVLGFLPGYLDEEGYDGTERFPVLRLVLPAGVVPAGVVAAVAALILAAAAGLVGWRTDPDHPADGAVVVVGIALLLTGPSYPWYALILVALVTLSRRWIWLVVAAAAYPPYFVGALHLPVEATFGISYGAAALVLAGAAAPRAVRVARARADEA